MYPHQKLGHVFPRLYDIAEGENLATSLLQVFIYYFLFNYLSVSKQKIQKFTKLKIIDLMSNI